MQQEVNAATTWICTSPEPLVSFSSIDLLPYDRFNFCTNSKDQLLGSFQLYSVVFC